MPSRTPGARAAVVLTAALTLGPAAAAAQQPMPQARRACVAQISPAAVPAGLDAVRVMASLSQDVGTVEGLEAPRGSGITLASPDDVPRTEMIAAGGPRRAIQMGAGEYSWALWLNTVEARPGTHRVRVVAEGGVCEGRLSVTPGTRRPDPELR